MDFFKSILADDGDYEESDNHEESETDPRPNQSPKRQEMEGTEGDDSNLNSNSPEDGGVDGDGGGFWSFGGLVKTITTRSESVLETYRRDLKEFSSGLRKESDILREVASRAVKELPSSLEVGASAIDGVLKSTADIIAQGKDALLAPSDVDDFDASEVNTYSDRSGLNSMRYSRFDLQLNAIQSDTRTYCEDPEDLDDYSKWKLGFVLGDKRDEIEKLVGDGGPLQGIYEKLVPNEVDDGAFWFRYFYRAHKLKQQEDLRANLVKRSLTVDDEEELSWDVDDDDDDDDDEPADQVKPNTPKTQHLPEKKDIPNDEFNTESCKVVDDDREKNTDVDSLHKNNESSPKPSPKSDEKVESLAKSDEKDSDLSIVSTQAEEEDLEWDEIEDLGNNDETKNAKIDTPNKHELRKRLSAAEDDEDLSWDIEDDDEPVKTGK